MPDPLDITGRRFGHLTALKFVSRNRRGQARWQCQCDCGGQAIAYSHDLVSGAKHSCAECVERVEIEENAKREAAIQQELEETRAAVRHGKPLPVLQVRKP
jgi:hypothetical protein